MNAISEVTSFQALDQCGFQDLTKGFPMQDINFSKDGICSFLRRAFPSATALNVSAATSISSSTVDKWLRGESAPSAAHVGVLVGVFGPAFMATAYPVTKPWLESQVRSDRIQAALMELECAIQACEI